MQFVGWRRLTGGWVMAGVTALAACGGSGGGAPAPESPQRASPLGAEAALGEKAFHDPVLSASGRLSCASCHDPAHAHAPANALAVQLGGADLSTPGIRAVPSLRYLMANGPFHFGQGGKPFGGFFWDGRAASAQAQAAGPLLGAHEMGNRSPAEVAARIGQASWADEFVSLYGAEALLDGEKAVERLSAAIARYQFEEPQFNPFTSKFDAVLRGQAQFTDAEARGQALFDSPAKGNCAQCHVSWRDWDGSFPLFTNFGYEALGVPRNPAIPANADPTHYDLGLCGRPELADRTDLCGYFRVPSLRNVAQRGVFFHNGRFTSLRDVVAFYAQRDTSPEKFYPVRSDGTVEKFDDLPPALRANVNTRDVPYNRRRGEAPVLTEAEVDDLVAFLKTLSDGWAAP